MLIIKRSLVLIVSLFSSFNLYAQDYAIQEIEPNKEEVQNQSQNSNSEYQNSENQKDSISDKVTIEPGEIVTSANGYGEPNETQNQNMNEQQNLQSNDINND
jgi:hypothetical protein